MNRIANRVSYSFPYSTPFFVYVNWLLPYSSSYLSLYFSVRARALASLVSALAQIAGTAALGSFLDWKRISLATRARVSYVFLMALIGGCWIWGAVVQAEYARHPPSLDWDDAGFGRGWALYVLWQVNFALTYNYGYWLVGWMSRHPSDVVRYTSAARALESAGQCVSSGISSTSAPVSPPYLFRRKSIIDFRLLTSTVVDRRSWCQLCPLGYCSCASLLGCQASRPASRRSPSSRSNFFRFGDY